MAPGHSSPTLRPTASLSPRMSARSLSPHSSFRAPKQRNAAKPAQPSPLPRFHPANWPSQTTSPTNPSSSGRSSPQQPSSPRQQHRHISEVHRQLYMYQRDLMANTLRGAQAVSVQKPASPRLIPLVGSPGPVTPMMLEERDGYMDVGPSSAGRDSGNAGQEGLVEQYIRQETQRTRPRSPRLLPR